MWEMAASNLHDHVLCPQKGTSERSTALQLTLIRASERLRELEVKRWQEDIGWDATDGRSARLGRRCSRWRDLITEHVKLTRSVHAGAWATHFETVQETTNVLRQFRAPTSAIFLESTWSCLRRRV